MSAIIRREVERPRANATPRAPARRALILLIAHCAGVGCAAVRESAPPASDSRQLVTSNARPLELAVKTPSPDGISLTGLMTRPSVPADDVSRVPRETNESSVILSASPRLVPLDRPEFVLDLPFALRVAEFNNPLLGEARAAILDALAQQQAARVLLLPSIQPGTSYHAHQGVYQRAGGQILDVSSRTFFVGAGARSQVAETMLFPGVRIFSPLADAVFEPLAARQRVAATGFDLRSTTNTVLGEVAEYYLELLGAQARFSAQSRTILESHQLARLNRSYANVGQVQPSDAARAETQLRLFEAKRQRIEEDLEVAAARLARRLHMDPSARLRAIDGPLIPLVLVDAERPLPELVQQALRQRPELSALGYEIGEARTHVRKEQVRPWLPTIQIGMSAGGFAGGSNLEPPLLGNFAGRTDFDVLAYWTVENLGLGNLGRIKVRRAELGAVEAKRLRMIDTVRNEVGNAYAVATARRLQLESARAQLASAELGFREDFIRAQGAVGKPIEVVNSLQLLADARLELIDALIAFNQAQFALFVAVGTPPPAVSPIGPN